MSLLVAWGALVAVAAACGAEGPGREAVASTDDPAAEARAGEVLTGEILVSAAASLSDVFLELEYMFESDHPSVDVVLNLGGSSSLRAQVLEGAPVDVFASANRENMARLVDAGHVVGASRTFARNRLQIAVPRGNPAGVRGLASFTDPALRLGLCDASVPCGDFARQVMERAGVVPSLDTNEPDVRALLTKIELGELDAGITYVTDVASTHGEVEGIDIPEEVNVAAEYPIAVLAGAPHREAATAFVAFVLSPRADEVLSRFGFLRP